MRKLLLLSVIHILILFNENPHKVKGGSQIFNAYDTMEKWGTTTVSIHYSPDIVKPKIYCGQISTLYIMRIN